MRGIDLLSPPATEEEQWGVSNPPVKRRVTPGGKMDNHEERIAAHRVITMLNREELDFLDKLGKDALFTTGHKLSHNEILKGLIDFAIELGLSGERIDSFRTLKEKMLERMRQEQDKKELNNEK